MEILSPQLLSHFVRIKKMDTMEIPVSALRLSSVGKIWDQSLCVQLALFGTAGKRVEIMRYIFIESSAPKRNRQIGFNFDNIK